MLAVVAWSQCMSVRDRAVLCRRLFSHASAKISMGKVGLRHSLRRKERHTDDEGAPTCQPFRPPSAGAAATYDVVPVRSAREWDTSKFAGGQQHTQDTSPQNRPPRVKALIVTTLPPIKTQQHQAFCALPPSTIISTL